MTFICLLNQYNKIKNLMKKETNYLTEENSATIEYVSSEVNSCNAVNLIKSDRKVYSSLLK